MPGDYSATWRRWRSMDEVGVVVALLSVCGLLWLSVGDRFVQPTNLLQVARQASSYGMMSVGMVLLLAMGEIDLSVGAILTLVNIVAAVALQEGVPMPLAVLAGLATGAACGLTNGLLSVWLRIPTIIVTLGTMSVYRGLALVLSKATAVANFSKDNVLFDLGSRDLLGVPTSVWLMITIGLAGHGLLMHTVFGWRLQAIGSNAQAARFSGIPMARYRVAAMTIMGLVAGIAGLMELAFLQSGSPTTGQGYELYVIASAIIGGTALTGGSGSVAGGILGALLIAVIRNGLVLLELSAVLGHRRHGSCDYRSRGLWHIGKTTTNSISMNDNDSRFTHGRVADHRRIQDTSALDANFALGRGRSRPRVWLAGKESFARTWPSASRPPGSCSAFPPVLRQRARLLASSLPLLMALFLATGCNRQTTDDKAAVQPTGKLKLGYVLHGLNQFTQIIEQGAKDGARAEGVIVDVVGPASFSTTTDAIAMFEGMTQKRVKGLVVIPMPGEVWVTPIRQATEAGIPVLTANVTSPNSTATAWFGQDEYASGVILATELRKFLTTQNKREGRIIVGICAPGVGVLVERYEGFKKGMAGTNYQVSDPFDVNTENTANYGAWENLAGANPGMVAIVGLCSMDLPNLAKLKARTKGQWLVAGYDLGRETLDALRAGTVQLALGQHPYLQGYLPVVALSRHLRDKRPLPRGWIDIGTEVITQENVDAVYGRETDPAKQAQWYAEYVAKHFADLNALAKPLPQAKK